MLGNREKSIVLKVVTSQHRLCPAHCDARQLTSSEHVYQLSFFPWGWAQEPGKGFPYHCCVRTLEDLEDCLWADVSLQNTQHFFLGVLLSAHALLLGWLPSESVTWEVQCMACIEKSQTPLVSCPPLPSSPLPPCFRPSSIMPEKLFLTWNRSSSVFYDVSPTHFF